MPKPVSSIQEIQPVMLGSDILGYSFAREYYRIYNGVKTIIISPIDNKLTSSSKFCTYVIEPNSNDGDFLLAYLKDLGAKLEKEGKRGLLVGCADWRARFLAEHKPELDRWFFIPYVDFQTLDFITQKSAFYTTCEELGIPYPKTWELDCSHKSTAPDPEQFTYPLIAKPANSAAYEVCDIEGKEKIYELKSPDELLKMWKRVKKGGYPYPMLLQDYIPGGDEALFSLTVYCTKGGEAKVISGGQVLLQDHSASGIGNPVCILRKQVDAIVEPALRMLKHLQYHGYANFDIKYDKRDDTYKFFEVNTRMGRNTYYVSLGGVPFVEPLVRDFALGEDLGEVRYAYDPFLYVAVPKAVLLRYTAPGYHAVIEAAFKEGWAKNPLVSPNETFIHNIWTGLYLARQNSKYKSFMSRADF